MKWFISFLFALSSGVGGSFYRRGFAMDKIGSSVLMRIES